MLQIKLLYCFFSHKLIKTKILIKKKLFKNQTFRGEILRARKRKKKYGSHPSRTTSFLYPLFLSRILMRNQMKDFGF